MKHNGTGRLQAILLIVCGLLNHGCSLFGSDSACLENQGPWGEQSDGRMNLGQCWNDIEQKEFYTTTQGSQIAPFDIASSLEWHDQQAPFLTPATIKQFGYVVNESTSPWPLGFVKDSVESGEFKGEWIGMSCAACHTAEIEYQGHIIRIDGGPTMGDFTGFIRAFDRSLQETYQDGRKEEGRTGEKFARYAKHFPDETPTALLERIQGTVERRQAWRMRNDPPTSGNPGFPGYGRLDAFGVIFNEVTNHLLGILANNRLPDAPVSYPFLWGTHDHDWTQWNGISAAIPMGRNVGQVLGVFGQVHMESDETSIRLKNLRSLQGLVKKLRSPTWPEGILGKIDQEKAQKGKALFAKHCASCHAQQNRSEPLTSNDVTMTRLDRDKTTLACPPAEQETETLSEGEVLIGTDPKMALNALRCVRTAENKSKQEQANDTVGGIAINVISQDWWELLLVGIDAISAFFDKWTLTQPTPLAYKARPLDGIWATAPYLHNGAVPNLYELLLPENERTRRFCVGPKDFDPERVGFMTRETCPDSAGTVLDTSLEGNRNTGHTDHIYGTTFTEEQRWQLVEYQKTL